MKGACRIKAIPKCQTVNEHTKVMTKGYKIQNIKKLKSILYLDFKTHAYREWRKVFVPLSLKLLVKLRLNHSYSYSYTQHVTATEHPLMYTTLLTGVKTLRARGQILIHRQRGERRIRRIQVLVMVMTMLGKYTSITTTTTNIHSYSVQLLLYNLLRLRHTRYSRKCERKHLWTSA
ncbi:hypothetical protein M0804_009319 [Polistes exclamans]|nr:hypothetical protein M0804_009319 [Polistes exclamans]